MYTILGILIGAFISIGSSLVVQYFKIKSEEKTGKKYL